MNVNEPPKLTPLDRKQLLLFLIVFFAGVVVVVSIILDSSLHTYRYLGNAALSPHSAVWERTFRKYCKTL
jgi:hypothetical protein